MKKNIHKLLVFLNHNKFVVGSFLLVSIFLLSFRYSYATCNFLDVGCYLDEGIGFLLTQIGTVILQMAAFILQAALGVFVELTSWLVDSPQINIAWILIRDFVNMFFIFFLLFASIAKLIGKESVLKHKKVVTQIIWILIGAFLVNFSKAIFGVIIDISQIVTLQFTNAFSGSLSSFSSIFTDMTKNLTSGNGAVPVHALFGLLVLVFALAFVAVCFSAILYFLIRAVSFGVYSAMSPLLFFFWAFPVKNSTIDDLKKQTTDKFFQVAIGGPVFAFYLWFSLMLFSSGDNILSNTAGKTGPGVKTSDIDKKDPAVDASGNKIDINTAAILKMVIAIAVMVFAQKQATELSKKAGSVLGKGFSSMVDGVGKMGMKPLDGLKGLGMAGVKATRDIAKEKVGNLSDSARAAVGNIGLVKGTNDWVEGIRKRGEERAGRISERDKVIKGATNNAGRIALAEYQNKALENSKLGVQGFADNSKVALGQLRNTPGFVTGGNSQEYRDSIKKEEGNLKMLEAERVALQKSYQKAVSSGDTGLASKIKANLDKNQESIEESKIKVAGGADNAGLIAKLDQSIKNANAKNIDSTDLQKRKSALEKVRDDATSKKTEDKKSLQDNTNATDNDRLTVLQANRDKVKMDVDAGKRDKKELDLANARIAEEQKRLAISKKEEGLEDAKKSFASRQKLFSGKMTDADLRKLIEKPFDEKEELKKIKKDNPNMTDADAQTALQQAKITAKNKENERFAELQAKMEAAKFATDPIAKNKQFAEIAKGLELKNLEDVSKAEKGVASAEKDYAKSQEATKKSAYTTAGIETKEEKSDAQKKFDTASDSVKTDERYIDKETQKFDAAKFDGRNHADSKGNVRDTDTFLAGILAKIDAKKDLTKDEEAMLSMEENQKKFSDVISNYDKATIEKFNNALGGKFGIDKFTSKKGSADDVMLSNIERNVESYKKELAKAYGDLSRVPKSLMDKVKAIEDKAQAGRESIDDGKSVDGLLSLFGDLSKEKAIHGYTVAKEFKGIKDNDDSFKGLSPTERKKYEEQIETLRASRSKSESGFGDIEKLSSVVSSTLAKKGASGEVRDQKSVDDIIRSYEANKNLSAGFVEAVNQARKEFAARPENAGYVQTSKGVTDFKPEMRDSATATILSQLSQQFSDGVKLSMGSTRVLANDIASSVNRPGVTAEDTSRSVHSMIDSDVKLRNTFNDVAANFKNLPEQFMALSHNLTEKVSGPNKQEALASVIEKLVAKSDNVDAARQALSTIRTTNYSDPSVVASTPAHQVEIYRTIQREMPSYESAITLAESRIKSRESGGIS